MELPELADRLDDLSPAPARQCSGCGRRFVDYAYSSCSACGQQLETVELAQLGTVLAITRSHRRREQTIFAIPYTVALIRELHEKAASFLCPADDPHRRLAVGSRVALVQRQWRLADGEPFSAVIAVAEEG